MPGGATESGKLDIEIKRSRSHTRTLARAVPKKVRTEEIRLDHVAAIKEVRRMANEGRFSDAQEKLAVAMGVLDDALAMADSDVSKSAVEHLYAEVEELFAATESEEKYRKQGGQVFVLACISSHDRQRFAARGDDGCRIRLFATPRMEQYLDEAIEFDRMSCTV